VIVDVRRGVEDEERQLVDFLRQPREVSSAKPVEVILAATKVDKLGPASRKPALEAVKRRAGGKVVGFSGETGEGMEELWGRIRAAVL
jgi:GTP-binding protein EngB required for normal cell division